MDKGKMTDEEFTRSVDVLLRPLSDTDQIDFEDLFDLEAIQRLQDDFAKATNVASIITRVDGTPVTRPSNFSRLCNDIIRKTEKGSLDCCESERAVSGLNDEGPAVRLCINGGLWDAGAGIAVGGRHIANWLVGQVRNLDHEEESIQAYAREIGIDEHEMLDAYREVPAMSREQFQCVANMLFSLARQLSNLANKNVLQNQYIEKYRQLHQELKEREETMRRITSSAQDAIVMMDENGCISFWNESAESIFGYTQDEILGKNLHACLAPRQFENRYQPALAVFKLSGTGSNLNRVQELCAIKKDGSIFPVELSLSALEAGGKWHAIGIIRDITSRVNAEKAEREMAETLKHSQKMAAIGTLAGGIAHDFNNILSAILGFADLLTYTVEPETKAAQFVNNITEAGTRAKNLVEQILAFSRQVENDVQPVSVKMICREVLNLIEASVPANIRIGQEIESDSSVMGDPAQVHQVVVNLCTNAVQAVEEGSGVVEVKVRDVDHDPDNSGRFLALSPGRYIELVVSDNGCGIAPDVLERIFEPFFTTRKPGKGTGMGLAVVHGIVKRCNGGIHVESEQGKGSVFTVLLPAIAEISPAEAAKEDSPGVTSAIGTERLLIVDDEKAIIEILSQTLSQAGYQITAATDPQEALDIFSQQPADFDLVITDLTMPQLTGDRLAQNMLAIRPDMPFI